MSSVREILAATSIIFLSSALIGLLPNARAMELNTDVGVTIDGPFGIPLGGVLLNCDTGKAAEFYAQKEYGIGRRAAYKVWSVFFEFEKFAREFDEVNKLVAKLKSRHQRLQGEIFLKDVFGESFSKLPKDRVMARYAQLANNLTYNQLYNLGIPVNAYFNKSSVTSLHQYCITKTGSNKDMTKLISEDFITRIFSSSAWLIVKKSKKGPRLVSIHLEADPDVLTQEDHRFFSQGIYLGLRKKYKQSSINNRFRTEKFGGENISSPLVFLRKDGVLIELNDTYDGGLWTLKYDGLGYFIGSYKKLLKYYIEKLDEVILRQSKPAVLKQPKL